MRPVRSACAAAGIAAFLASAAHAQPVAITDARIFTMGPQGEIASGTIMFDEDGVIAVGDAVDIPSDARVIDGRGGIVTPGLIAADTSLGVREINSARQTLDDRSRADGISAAFDVSYGINPASHAIPVARLGGVTRAVVSPAYDDSAEDRGLLFAGQAALIALSDREEPPFRRVSMTLALDERAAERAGGSRGAAHTLLRTQLGAIRAGTGGVETGLSVQDLQALVPVLDGEQPLVISVSRASDILQVISLAEELGLEVILNGAEEGWMVAERIAAAGIPVIVNPTANLPSRFEMLNATFGNAATLGAAGVPIAIVGNDNAHRVREMRYNAGMAVARGLPYEAALAALTVNPATMFGVDDRLGSLEPGKLADIVLWSGDPLEPASQPQAIFISGRQQPLTSRALELRDRYMPLICETASWAD